MSLSRKVFNYEYMKEGEKMKVSKKKLEIAMARAELNRNTLAEKANIFEDVFGYKVILG